jgi:outer membrane PBP1 activator LpoA protein
MKSQKRLKVPVGLRVEKRLKEGLDARAQATGRPATAILEEYMTAGLARDSGELIEQNSLPAIRAAVREEVAAQMTILYQQLSADLQKSARRSDDRLAALIVKAARYAGIGQRMVYTFLARTVNPEYAAKVFDDASAKVGQDIARPEPKQ